MKSKLLLVDDDADVCAFYASVLRSDYEVKVAHDADVVYESLNEFNPDLVVLDVDLPGQNGLDVCRKIRGLTKHKPYIAIIFLTGNSSTHDILKGLEIGGDDYLAKPCSVPELKARIKTNLRIKRMTDELEEARKTLENENRKLELLTITDELTSLFTMRHFSKRLEEEHSRACRYNYSVSLIMIDLDHFKRVNDSFSHMMGSYVLAQVGERIKNQLRSEDTAARYGGDEFAIMLPHTDSVGAMAFGKRVADAIAASDYVLDTNSVKVTASMGVYTFDGSKEERSDGGSGLIKCADKLLYQAKRAGRNRLVGGSS
ncbi:MAG: diguanylate cyclase [Pseudomonadota bacterium]|nr:diguanylate cyclase [Pseudomonadota bacterium]